MMTRHAGIILAGGEATRMNNKLLLPIGVNGDTLLVESAMRLCKSAGCDQLVIACRKPDEALVHVLRSLRGWTGISFVAEDGGLQKAILKSVESIEADRYVIAFGDNIYSNSEYYEIRPSLEDHGAVASIRRNAKGDLDKWTHGDEMWLRRTEVAVEDTTPFAGWIVGGRESMRTICDTAKGDLIAGMNRADVQPITVDLPWWDVGTKEGYETYIRSLTRV